jgi:hypothetical protein
MSNDAIHILRLFHRTVDQIGVAAAYDHLHFALGFVPNLTEEEREALWEALTREVNSRIRVHPADSGLHPQPPCGYLTQPEPPAPDPEYECVESKAPCSG